MRKGLSFLAVAVGVLTGCLAGFFLAVSLVYSSRVAKLHLSDMPQTRLERLVKTGYADGLRADFDGVVAIANASMAATDNRMVNMRTPRTRSLVSL